MPAEANRYDSYTYYQLVLSEKSLSSFLPPGGQVSTELSEGLHAFSTLIETVTTV